MGFILNNFNHLFAGDWILLLIFLGVALIYGFLMGSNRLALIILGTYFSFFIIKNIPWKSLGFLGLEKAPSSNVQIFLFLALILGFYFLLPHSIFNVLAKSQRRRRTQWWQGWLLAILQIGLMLEVVINFLPVKILKTLNPLAQTIFVDPLAQFLWIFLPILAMMFLKNRYSYDLGD